MIKFSYDGPNINVKDHEVEMRDVLGRMSREGETEFSAYGHVALLAIRWCESQKVGYSLVVSPEHKGYKVVVNKDDPNVRKQRRS